MRIVDRANGRILLEVPDDQGEMLTDLVEDVQSFQVSELFLEVAEREGVEAGILARLRAELSGSPTLFVGVEPQVDGEQVRRLAGQLLDYAGTPLGGLVVTAQSSDEDAVNWAFSRPDGSFELRFAGELDPGGLELLVASRSGLLLSSFELDELGEQVEQMAPFQVATLQGRILTESGSPLVGARVEAWSTWSATDEQGRFLVPVDRLGEELHLEVFAPSGEPLGGYWKVSLPKESLAEDLAPSGPVDLGDRTVPEPKRDWPDSDQRLIATEFANDAIFPGVSDHPLS